MKNIVLAAGYATRLYPLTENFPKPLLEIGGKTILDRMLEDIDSLEEIDEHIIISNHRYVEHFENWKKNCNIKKPITILDDGSVSNDTRLGAVKDIQFAIDECNIDDDIMVVAGDNIMDFSFSPFVDLFKEKNAAVVICNYEENPDNLRRSGVMIPDEDFRVVSMEEKPAEPKSNWCVGPFYIYKRDELHWIKQGIEDGCGTDAPGSMISYLCEKVPVYALKAPGFRYDIGTHESLAKVRNIFEEK